MQRIGIEAFLRWVWCEELPLASARVSVAGPGRAASRDAAALMAAVDGGDAPENVFGVVEAFMALRPPHADAISAYGLMAPAADGLALVDEVEPCFAEGGDLAADLGDLGAEGRAAIARAVDLVTLLDGEGRRHLRDCYRPSGLLRKWAILGGGPETRWMDGPIGRVALAPAHGGKPLWFRREVRTVGGVRIEVEVDGFCRRSQRPYGDAYRKFRLAPDPVPVLVDRLEYDIWLAAMKHLAGLLDGRLCGHEVCPSARAASPWLVPERRPVAGQVGLTPHGGRILVDLAMQARAAACGPKRRIRVA